MVVDSGMMAPYKAPSFEVAPPPAQTQNQVSQSGVKDAKSWLLILTRGPTTWLTLQDSLSNLIPLSRLSLSKIRFYFDCPRGEYLLMTTWLTLYSSFALSFPYSNPLGHQKCQPFLRPRTGGLLLPVIMRAVYIYIYTHVCVATFVMPDARPSFLSISSVPDDNIVVESICGNASSDDFICGCLKIVRLGGGRWIGGRGGYYIRQWIMQFRSPGVHLFVLLLLCLLCLFFSPSSLL